MFFLFTRKLHLKSTNILCNFSAWVCIESTYIETTLKRNDWFSVWTNQPIWPMATAWTKFSKKCQSQSLKTHANGILKLLELLRTISSSFKLSFPRNTVFAIFKRNCRWPNQAGFLLPAHAQSATQAHPKWRFHSSMKLRLCRTNILTAKFSIAPTKHFTLSMVLCERNTLIHEFLFGQKLVGNIACFKFSTTLINVF